MELEEIFTVSPFFKILSSNRGESGEIKKTSLLLRSALKDVHSILVLFKTSDAGPPAKSIAS